MGLTSEYTETPTHKDENIWRRRKHNEYLKTLSYLFTNLCDVNIKKLQSWLQTLGKQTQLQTQHTKLLINSLP